MHRGTAHRECNVRDEAGDGDVGGEEFVGWDIWGRHAGRAKFGGHGMNRSIDRRCFGL